MNTKLGAILFLAASTNIKLGLTMMLAIALHNIPDGLAISLSLFYANGSKLKALILTAVVGSTQMLGAIIAYATLGSKSLLALYGALFGAISGMLIFVSLVELFPIALTHDAATAKYAVFLGMALMAVALVAFD